MRYLLDTNCCSYVQRGYPQIIEHIKALPADAELVTSVISQGELLSGVYLVSSAKRREELSLSYQKFFRQIVDVLALTGEVADHYASILNALRVKGRPIPTNDIWIAAVAQVHDLTLVSHDQHFRFIDNLEVEDWMA